MQLKIIVIMFLAGMLLLTAGCGKKEAQTETYKIGLVMKAASNPFFARMEEGARLAADSLKIELLVGAITQETDINQQISIVENMIVQGVQVLLITPADSKSIINVLKSAQDVGIRIINVDNRIDAETARLAGLKIECYVGVDNVVGGKMAGDYLVQLMGGRGKVAMLEGIRGVDNAEARKRGFLKAIENSEIELVASQSANWAQDQGLDVFTNMLQANPEIKGLFCANDMMALGAIQAIEQAGKAGQIFVTSYDNLKAAQESILQGKLQATIEQHPEKMGYEGVVLAWDLLNGKTIPEEKLIKLDLVTKDHLLNQ